MTLDVYLSVFTLILISLGINILALKTRLPYTVLLVVAGSLLVPLSKVDAFSFVTSFQLTPELLFFVFLPILIFESAYNMKLRNIKDNKLTISVLAIVGLLISTFCIGFVGHWGLQLLGLHIPLLVTLLFGAIISSTDPVAVLALFKECGVPHRLTLLFEGESLFNDGTAFAVFLVFLDIIIHGYDGFPTVLEGVFAFCTMILGGIVFGLCMGFLFSKLIEWVKGHDHLEITLTLLVAHFTFLLAELISQTWVVDGHKIHISAIIATLFSSLVMGNFGRYKMSFDVERYMDKFWSYFAFLANSLVFILMGLLFTSLFFSSNIPILPISTIILVVVASRAVSIYFSIGIVNLLKYEEHIPSTWQHLLSWGSLRGSLALIMVLLIPDDISLPDWPYEVSIKEFLIAITIGSIYFTLLIKAPTIGKLVQWLKIDQLLPHENLSYYKSKALIYRDLSNHIEALFSHGEISERQYEKLKSDYQRLYQKIREQYRNMPLDSSHVVENVLRIYTLGLQKNTLKKMFQSNEITERIYKRNLEILETQTEKVEQDQPKLKSINEYLITWVGALRNLLRRVLCLRANKEEAEELYLYYRTQTKLIDNVLHELSELEKSPLMEIFDDQRALQNVISIYKYLKAKAVEQMQHELSTNQALLDDLNERSAKALLQAAQNERLRELHENEIISSKLYVLLMNELNK
ncbi:MAG: cation:proton antiporter [Deltaproteobacteria bacterium]|nr:cation:proton antiporter [Deltaproteobacteria bacterium]